MFKYLLQSTQEDHFKIINSIEKQKQIRIGFGIARFVIENKIIKISLNLTKFT